MRGAGIGIALQRYRIVQPGELMHTVPRRLARITIAILKLIAAQPMHRYPWLYNDKRRGTDAPS
jgi:hypothetical protein